MLMQWERFRGNRPDLSERKIDFVAPDPKAESDVGRARGVGNVRDSEGGGGGGLKKSGRRKGRSGGDSRACRMRGVL